MVSKGDSLRGAGDGLEVRDGNAIKLGCDNHCTTISVIKFIELKIKEESELTENVGLELKLREIR